VTMRKSCGPQRPTGLTRRDWLRLSTVGTVAFSGTSWLQALADDAAAQGGARRSCILLWMTGGPSQLDTFDMKPGHEHGGPIKEIATSVPGLRFSEHLPELAGLAEHLAVVRSMTSREGDHERASYFVRTGYLPQASIQFPAFGAVAAKELVRRDSDLPQYVTIAPGYFTRSAAAGYLGARYAPLVVGDEYDQETGDGLQVRNLTRADQISQERFQQRLAIRQDLESLFPGVAVDPPVVSRRVAYDDALRYMRGPARTIFDLTKEPDSIRDAYGRNAFGQGCLLARRLVEQGVPFIEVSLNSAPDSMTFGWDSHSQNFQIVPKLCQVLDPAWAQLLSDLKARGLLESTLIVWMGEFGRTPRINGASGRDHFPDAWSTVLCGGGISGGQAIGATSDDGTEVTERPVRVPDLLATVGAALGVDCRVQNMSNIGRPIRLVNPESEPIKEALL
jgi:hypothetical protein